MQGLCCLLYSYGLYSYGLDSYGLDSYGLDSCGLDSHGLDSHGLYSYGLCSYGLILEPTVPWQGTHGSEVPACVRHSIFTQSRAFAFEGYMQGPSVQH